MTNSAEHTSEPALRGLTVDVYRRSGVASTFAVSKLTIVGTRVDTNQGHGDVRSLVGRFPVCEPSTDAPAAVVVYRNLRGHQIVHVEPLAPVPDGHAGYMAGGSYVACSDSRWDDLIGFYGAVSLHDRTEPRS